MVPDGVAGTADALDLLQAQARPVGYGPRRRRKRLAEYPVQMGDVPDLARGDCGPVDQVAQVGAVRLVQQLHQPDPDVQAGTFDGEQRGIHFVRAAPRSQADDPARLQRGLSSHAPG